MKFNNLDTQIRNMTDGELWSWNATYPKEQEYIVTIYLDKDISDMLPSKIGKDNPFYRKNATEWEAEFIDKYGDGLEDIEEIYVDDFIEAFEEDFNGSNYEIEVFRERFMNILEAYQGEFEEKVQERLEEFSDLKEVLTMSRMNAEWVCRLAYTEGWRDFKIIDDDEAVSLEMAINIFGDEWDSENPFDLVFYDEQGFEHYRVPKLCSEDSEKVEEYDNLVKETLDNLDEILQYVYDERYSDETYNIKIGEYNLIISPYDNY